MTSFKLPNPENPSQWTQMSEDATRALGAKAVGVSPADKLIVNEIAPEPDFESSLHTAFKDTNNLCDLAGIPHQNFHERSYTGDAILQLQRFYNLLDERGFNPLVVVSINRKEVNEWANILGRAYDARGFATSGSQPKLAVNDTINNAWRDVVTRRTHARHSISVIAGKPVESLTWNYRATNDEIHPDIKPLDDTVDFGHPQIDAYLTLQAIRCMNNQALLDRASTQATWLNPVIVKAGEGPHHPCGNWANFTNKAMIDTYQSKVLANARPSICWDAQL